nr:MAG TPA: hypothetical protein [Caudoviricetes sp.]
MISPLSILIITVMSKNVNFFITKVLTCTHYKSILMVYTEMWT